MIIDASWKETSEYSLSSCHLCGRLQDVISVSGCMASKA